MVELKMLVATCYETTNLKSGKIFAINQENYMHIEFLLL